MPLFSNRRREANLLTVRRTRESKILPERRNKQGDKLAPFPRAQQPGYDPIYQRILPVSLDFPPHKWIELFLPEFFNAYWQILHAISFLPAEPEATESMLTGVCIFFAGLGNNDTYMPSCSNKSCKKHFQQSVIDAGGETGLLQMIQNTADKYALARWLNGVHNDVHRRRRNDTKHEGIIKRPEIPFAQVKSYYTKRSGPPLYLPFVECWLYTQFGINIRKYMERINEQAVQKEVFKAFAEKITKKYKQDIIPYGPFNTFWRRPTHVLDGYLVQTTPFPFTIVHALGVYCILHTFAMRLLTTHRFVLERKVTRETLIMFATIIITTAAIGHACRPLLLRQY